MKTLSQNTTSSACAPETDLQKLVATPAVSYTHLEHLLVHHPMLEGILLSECERLRQRSLANKLISLFRQFGGTELRLKLVWLCWLDLMTGNCLDDWTENLKRKSEKELEDVYKRQE